MSPFPSNMRLKALLHHCFQTDDTTIEQFVLRHFAPEQRREITPLLDRFIAVFNALKVHVFQHGKGGSAAQRYLGNADIDYATSMAAAIWCHPSTRRTSGARMLAHSAACATRRFVMAAIFG